MSRVRPASWSGLLEGANRAYHNRVWFGPPAGALVDLSDYLLPGWEHSQGVEAPIDALRLMMDRSLGLASLAPLMTADPPIDVGYTVVFEEAVTALGAAPVEADYMELFRGRVHGWDATGNPMGVQCYDLGRRLQQLYTLPGQTYLKGAALEAVMQDVLDDAPGSTETLDVPTSPGATLVLDLKQNHEPLLQAQLALAASIGWQARYWWHEAGAEFRFSLLEPPRAKTLADWTTGPNRYLAVPELKLDDADIRNHVTVYYGPKLAETGEQASVIEFDQDSIDKYGLIPIVLREGTDSPVQNAGQARELALAALSDLSEPQVTHTIEDFDLPHLTIWDLLELAANSVHYNATQTLAVQTIRRYSPAPGVVRIALGMRGKPSAGIGTWKRRAKVGQIIEAAKPPDPTYGRLLNWQPIPASADNKLRFGFERGPGVASVWSVAMDFPAPWNTAFFATLKASVQLVPAAQDWVEMDAASADRIESMRTEPRLAGGGIVEGDDVVRTIILDPVDPKIHGWIDARYEVGVLKVYAGCNPTASALPIAYEIRADSQTGSVLASGSFTTLAGAVTGVGGTGALTGLTPPADGKKFYFSKFTDVAGNVEWHSDSVENPVKPKVIKPRQADGSNDLNTDLYVTVESPLGRDISLKVWTNKASMDNADPAGAVDATLVQAFTAGTPGTVEFGPSNASLDNVLVRPGRGKLVYFEAIDELGISSGVQAFTLVGRLDLVGTDGKLIAGAVDRPAAFAASLRPPLVVGSLPADNTDSNLVFLTTDFKLYRWDDTANVWTVAVHGDDIVADTITGGKMVAAAVGAREGAFHAFTAQHLNVADVYVTGMTTTNNSPGAGSVAWSSAAVDWQGARYAVAGGNSSAEVIWWSPIAGSGTAFQASSASGLEAAGYDQNRGDRIILLNEGGTARQVWNGTRIYGGALDNESVDTRHLVTDLAIIGKTIRSDNFSAGVSGWRLEDDTAEFNDVIVRGTLDGADGDFSGDLTADVVHVAGAVVLQASAIPPNDVGVPTDPAAVFQWGGGVGEGGARFIFDNNGGSGPVKLILQMRNVLSGDWFDTHRFNVDGTITDMV